MSRSSTTDRRLRIATIFGTSVLLVCVAAGLFARFYELGARQIAVDEYYFLEAVGRVLDRGLPEFPSGGYYARGLPAQYITAVSIFVIGDTGFAQRLGDSGGEDWQHVISPTSKFREIYFRQYLKISAGWSGIPRKYSRIRVLSDPQPGDTAHPTAFQGHFWQQINANGGGTIGGLMFDNARGVDENGTVIDTGNSSGNIDLVTQDTRINGDLPGLSAGKRLVLHRSPSEIE